MVMIKQPEMKTAQGWCKELGLNYVPQDEPGKMYTEDDFRTHCFDKMTKVLSNPNTSSSKPTVKLGDVETTSFSGVRKEKDDAERHEGSKKKENRKAHVRRTGRRRAGRPKKRQT